MAGYNFGLYVADQRIGTMSGNPALSTFEETFQAACDYATQMVVEGSQDRVDVIGEGCHWAVAAAPSKPVQLELF